MVGSWMCVEAREMTPDHHDFRILPEIKTIKHTLKFVLLWSRQLFGNVAGCKVRNAIVQLHRHSTHAVMQKGCQKVNTPNFKVLLKSSTWGIKEIYSKLRQMNTKRQLTGSSFTQDRNKIKQDFKVLYLSQFSDKNK